MAHLGSAVVIAFLASVALTPLARWLFGALSVLAVLGGLYAKGRHDGREACESRAAAAAAVEQLRQDAARAKALDNAVARELAARAAANALNDKVDAYERELAIRATEPSPAGACAPDYRLAPADARRLRDLRQ